MRPASEHIRSHGQELRHNSVYNGPFPNRLCAYVGVVRILYSKVYNFPHTHRHFVGQ